MNLQQVCLSYTAKCNFELKDTTNTMPTAQALIIDDKPTNIQVLQQLLRMEDVASVTISSTKDLAFQLDSIRNIDVVFVDLEMPIMNGYEVVEVIKANPHFRSAKVIAYSVHVTELNNALSRGFDGFLGKPVDAEAFSDQLQRILAGETVYYLP